ncbi:hypothetical protein GCM10010170_008650 [Dactylosporangium salmoneum]|uniref:Flp pilus-assembly TadG-like N-terminal domain-containing protein n=1 Tax=Dactylosporangium salmoneum TaxID=53361 RepID=A0ABP5SJY9_9ACTN
MTSRIKHTDDSGAALVLALVFVTVVAVVIATVLSFAATSIRATLNLRDQAAEAATADGAAQIAINTLRQGTFDGTAGKCFGATQPSLTLKGFYQASSGSTYSAYVTCNLDSAKSAASPVAISAANKPGSAVLTLGTAAAEDGINLKVSGGGTLKVHGSIVSNSNINVSQGTLATNASVTARTGCTGSITSVPAKVCNTATTTADPDYPAPTTTPTLQPVPKCSGKGKVVEFSAGRYTDLASLNGLTDNSGCKGSIFWFHPGTYYFDFGGEWLIDTGYLIGGTPTTQPVDGATPTIPGSCLTPIPPDPLPAGGWTQPGPNAGVQFVFGGASRIRVKAAQVEICGTYSKTSPPIAVYGLKAAVGSVPAQSGCVTTVPYSSGCAVIKTENSPNSRLYIQGTTYVPKAALDVQLNNLTGQVFRYGVISRSLFMTPTGSADLTGPVIEVPDDSPGYGLRTVVNLTVYICAGTAVCAADKVKLQATVGLVDRSGAPSPGKREVTIYNWSSQR